MLLKLSSLRSLAERPESRSSSSNRSKDVTAVTAAVDGQNPTVYTPDPKLGLRFLIIGPSLSSIDKDLQRFMRAYETDERHSRAKSNSSLRKKEFAIGTMDIMVPSLYRQLETVFNLGQIEAESALIPDSDDRFKMLHREKAEILLSLMPAEHRKLIESAADSNEIIQSILSDMKPMLNPEFPLAALLLRYFLLHSDVELSEIKFIPRCQPFKERLAAMSKRSGKFDITLTNKTDKTLEDLISIVELAAFIITYLPPQYILRLSLTGKSIRNVVSACMKSSAVMYDIMRKTSHDRDGNHMEHADFIDRPLRGSILNYVSIIMALGRTRGIFHSAFKTYVNSYKYYSVDGPNADQPTSRKNCVTTFIAAPDYHYMRRFIQSGGSFTKSLIKAGLYLACMTPPNDLAERKNISGMIRSALFSSILAEGRQVDRAARNEAMLQGEISCDDWGRVAKTLADGALLYPQSHETLIAALQYAASCGAADCLEALYESVRYDPAELGAAVRQAVDYRRNNTLLALLRNGGISRHEDVLIEAVDRGLVPNFVALVQEGNLDPDMNDGQALRKCAGMGRSRNDMSAAILQQDGVDPLALNGEALKKAMTSKNVKLVRLIMDHPSVTPETLLAADILYASLSLSCSKEVIDALLDTGKFSLEDQLAVLRTYKKRHLSRGLYYDRFSSSLRALIFHGELGFGPIDTYTGSEANEIVRTVLKQL